MTAREGALTGIKWSLRLFCLAVTLSIAGANIAWALLLACLLVFAASGGDIPRDAWKSRAAIPLFAFLGASALASALGVDPANSFRHINQDAHKIWLYLLFMTALTLSPDDDAHAFLGVGFAAAAAIGIWQALPSQLGAIFQPTAEWYKQRAHAFVHAVTFGEQMAVAALYAVCFLIAPPDRSSRVQRRLFAGLLILTAAALLLSGTRGALIGFVGGLVAVLAMIRGLRRYVLIALVLGAGLFAAMELQFPGRSLIRQMAGVARQEDPFARSLLRVRLFEVAVKMGLDHPLTGVGKNNFRAELPKYLSMVFEDESRSWGNAHNVFLHHFAERGLIGLAALVALLWVLWKRAFDRARRFGDGMNLWAHGTTTAFLLMNLTETALEVEIVWMLIFFVWILAETLDRNRRT